MPRMSGRQLVIVVVSVCAGAVLAPVSVSYAVGQLVNIGDAKTGVTARVGHDGTLNVESRAGVTQRAFNITSIEPATGGVLLFRSTPTNRVAITDLTGYQVNGPLEGSEVQLIAWTAVGKTALSCPATQPVGSKSWSQHFVRVFGVPNDTAGMLQLNFNGPPLILPDGSAPTTCLYLDLLVSAEVQFGISGYRYTG